MVGMIRENPSTDALLVSGNGTMPFFLLALLISGGSLQARRAALCDPRGSGFQFDGAAEDGPVAPERGMPGTEPKRTEPPGTKLRGTETPGDEPPEGELPGAGPAEREPRDSEPGEEAAQGADPPPRFAQAELELATGRQGERRVEVLARAAANGVTLVAGMESRSSDLSPERRAAILGAEIGAKGLTWEAEIRAAPETHGLRRFAAKLAARGEAVGLALLVRDEALGQVQLRAAGLSLDAESALSDSVAVAISAAAWATNLTGPRGKHDPWAAFGAATLDWAERWEVSFGTRHKLGLLTAAPAVAVSQPAQDGALSARAGLGLELALGAARLSAGAAIAHLWPSGIWLGEAMLGIAWHVGDD